jgi:hypothetical protein
MPIGAYQDGSTIKGPPGAYPGRGPFYFDPIDRQKGSMTMLDLKKLLDMVGAPPAPEPGQVTILAVRIVYGLFFEGKPYRLPHFLAGLSVTLVFIVIGGLLLVLGAWPFCRPHLREQLPNMTGH